MPQDGLGASWREPQTSLLCLSSAASVCVCLFVFTKRTNERTNDDDKLQDACRRRSVAAAMFLFVLQSRRARQDLCLPGRRQLISRFRPAERPRALTGARLSARLHSLAGAAAAAKRGSRAKRLAKPFSAPSRSAPARAAIFSPTPLAGFVGPQPLESLAGAEIPRAAPSRAVGRACPCCSRRRRRRRPTFCSGRAALNRAARGKGEGRREREKRRRSRHIARMDAMTMILARRQRHSLARSVGWLAPDARTPQAASELAPIRAAA